MKEVVVTAQNFEQEVLSNGKVLVDFWATWCGPCRMIAPILEDIANESNDIKVCKINVDEQEGLARQYGIMSIPTVIAFENGKKIATSVGVKSKESLVSLFD